MNSKSVYMYLLMLISTVKSYPVKRGDLRNSLPFKEEKRYPNGSVIGKYAYKDKEGNPIFVKYYADDSSYGVELKSVKVYDENSDVTQNKLPKVENIVTTPNMFQSLEAMSTMLNKEFNKNKTHYPFEGLNSYSNKINKYKGSHKAKDDYEIFLENDLKPSENCDKEKVKVYLDKNKRKNRNAPYHYAPSDYCERF